MRMVLVAGGQGQGWYPYGDLHDDEEHEGKGVTAVTALEMLASWNAEEGSVALRRGRLLYIYAVFLGLIYF